MVWLQWPIRIIESAPGVTAGVVTVDLAVADRGRARVNLWYSSANDLRRAAGLVEVALLTA